MMHGLSKEARFGIGLALFAAALGVSPQAAQAQCSSNGCNQETHHWNLNFNEVGQIARVGMVLLAGKFYPAMCNGTGNNSSMQGADSRFAYDTAQLTANSSFCMGAGNDQFTLLTAPISCCAGPACNTVFPIDLNGFRLSVSGEGGNDVMSLTAGGSAGAVDAYAMCGGSGNDRLTGGFDSQVISGGTGHDDLNGRQQSDTVRGNDGDDVIHHWVGHGTTDVLDGGNNEDCIESLDFHGIGTTCGAGTDSFDSDGILTFSCFTPVTNCCSVSPAC